MNPESYYNFRDEVSRRLEADLLGPTTEDEVITDAPITRYVTGILYPRSTEAIDQRHDVDEADEDETSAPDPAVALAHVRYPSSMGITFAVDPSATRAIRVTISAARYRPIGDEPLSEHSAFEGPPDQPDQVTSRSFRVDSRRWQRVPISPFQTELDITVAADDLRLEAAPGLELYARVRREIEGAVPVTLALINTNPWRGGHRDDDSFFQPSISVGAPEADRPPFVERPSRIPEDGADEESLSYRLLYRHAASFAVGHGCSATWEAAPESRTAQRVSTTYTPTYELLLADSNPAIDSPGLVMRNLAYGRRGDVVRWLSDVADEYERWIAGLRPQLEDIPEDLREAGQENVNRCELTLERIRSGVRLLDTDDRVWDAFRFANAVMLEQRARTEWLKENRPTPEPTDDDRHRWRPFQIAFITMCIEAIAHSDSEYRPTVDLLWFPTGGGKTEAYLGLIAFTIFHRRLKNVDGHGVTALMRYTLRLLTIQQFERAAMLICACERFRQTRRDLGSEPISIGLWVGRGATPLTRAEARRALDKLRTGVELEESNPVQLHRCPWCGTNLDHRNYYLAPGDTRLVADCRNRDCVFAGGLPVHLIDEDVYEFRPSLIVATADKFASMPWREQAASLFNLDRAGLRPPELIIQDELHLISGPLGTLAGLYETVVDLLCTQDGRPPKVVASTATIRRAGAQTRGLFARELMQFPPPGLDARDSHFAIEVPRDRKGTRLYVGLMAPGTSHTTLLVRTYAALLQSVHEIDAPDPVKDPYWTLVGYFNSLRVLGGARMQVIDDVTDRIELLANIDGSDPRRIDERIELTSREPSAHIPEYLNRMQLALPNPRTVDVILATNMISVGVDVDRLGLMAVMGQPPSTSEYIQATSRVGRRYPGLVVDLLNAARSRDRSHYESFVTYHSALYGHVEATSVTPFSARARDRALHAVIVSLARMLIPEFRPNDAAARILELEPRLAAVRDVILDRVRLVDPDYVEATERDFDQIIQDWKKRALERPELVFRDYAAPEQALLVDAGVDHSGDTGWPTLWSLRDVDRTSNLYLVY